MDAEFRFHLESRIADYLREGLSRDEAERRARVDFGPIDLAKDECRDEKPAAWLEHVGRDARYAWRSLRRNRGFALAAIATLALGIGPNTAIFSVVHAVLLKPLPYAQPEQLYSVEIVIPERRDQIPSLPASVQVFLEWRKARTTFAAMSALRPWECNVTGDGEPERVGGARVSANFFSVLGVPIERGRQFFAHEEQPGQERVVVISDALWRRRYGGDPAVIGSMLEINGDRHTVVGIAPHSLVVPTGTRLHSLVPFASRIDIWKPIAPTRNELRNESWDHGVLVRLPQGANLEAGRQQLESVLNEFARAQMPQIKTFATVRVVPIRDVFAGRIRLRLLLILGASTLLLLTACASLANLFLARAASRTHEFATRIALGAGRAHLVSQALSETTVLALIGGTIGAVLATSGARILVAYGPGDLHPLADTPVILPLVTFAMMTSLVTGLVCGSVSAWRAWRKDAVGELQEGGRGAYGSGRASRIRQILIGLEMALATALLASAGLLLHSFVNVMRADRGYQMERVLAVDLSLFGQRYAVAAGRAAFYRALVANVRGIPGVQGVGAISELPAVSESSGASRPVLYPTDTDFGSVVLSRPVAMIRSVTNGYFAAAGAALRAGRFFSDEERRPVAVISESLAHRLWPHETPAVVVGHTFRHGDLSAPLIAIAGVVADAHPGGVDREPQPVIYRPYEQWPSGPMTLVVRVSDEPAALAPLVRTEIRKMDPNLPIASIRTLREIVSSAVAERRFQMTLTTLFAVVALLLGAVGLYGVVSYSVTRRTREIGLRMALGAVKIDVLRSVMSNGMQPVAIGLAGGLGSAVAAASILRSVLFGVAPADPISMGVVIFVLLTASALACYLPARRAAALDPVTALRHE